MKISKSLFFLVLVLAALPIVIIAFSYNTSMLLEVKDINHYKVWDVEDKESINVVNLKDIFYPFGRVGNTVYLDKLANPVLKVHDGDTTQMVEQDAHQTIYTLDMDSTFSLIRIRIRNQFEISEWYIQNPKYLLIPTQKIEKDSIYPDSIDHYLCYEIIESGGEFLYEDLVLQDQYDLQRDTFETIDTIQAKHFCVPVNKNNEGVFNENMFLTWYDIFPQDNYITNDSIVNQFDSTRIYVEYSCGLLVPTTLKAWQFE